MAESPRQECGSHIVFMDSNPVPRSLIIKSQERNVYGDHDCSCSRQRLAAHDRRQSAPITEAFACIMQPDPSVHLKIVASPTPGEIALRFSETCLVEVCHTLPSHMDLETMAPNTATKSAYSYPGQNPKAV